MSSVVEYPLISLSITEALGERCPDFDPECWCCKAWAEFDALRAAISTEKERPLEEAAKALDAWGDIYGDNAAKTVRTLKEPTK